MVGRSSTATLDIVLASKIQMVMELVTNKNLRMKMVTIVSNNHYVRYAKSWGLQWQAKENSVDRLLSQLTVILELTLEAGANYYRTWGKTE